EARPWVAPRAGREAHREHTRKEFVPTVLGNDGHALVLVETDVGPPDLAPASPSGHRLLVPEEAGPDRRLQSGLGKDAHLGLVRPAPVGLEPLHVDLSLQRGLVTQAGVGAQALRVGAVPWYGQSLRRLLDRRFQLVVDRDR